MIVAIPASAGKTDALMDERFGRCPIFCLYDTVTKEVKFIENNRRNASTGVGPQVVEFLANNMVNEIYAVEVGPKAQMILNKLYIRIKLIDSGKTIREVINMLNH